MQVGNINNQGYLKGGLLQKIYETDIGSATTTVTVSGLDGDSDIVYLIVCRLVNGYSGSANILLRLNNDSGSNYGSQLLSGYGSSYTATQYTARTFMIGGAGNALGQESYCETLLYAKSGYVRTGLISVAFYITGTTVGYLQYEDTSWNNTVDNITSIVFAGDQTNCIGVGTHIEIWALKKHS